MRDPLKGEFALDIFCDRRLQTRDRAEEPINSVDRLLADAFVVHPENVAVARECRGDKFSRSLARDATFLRQCALPLDIRFLWRHGSPPSRATRAEERPRPRQPQPAAESSTAARADGAIPP